MQGVVLRLPAEICPALVSQSVELTCTLEGKPVRCDKGQLPGTRAKLKCKPSYRFPAGVTPDYDAVNCQADGTWDWPLFKCIPGQQTGQAAITAAGAVVNVIVNVTVMVASVSSVTEHVPTRDSAHLTTRLVFSD